MNEDPALEPVSVNELPAPTEPMPPIDAPAPGVPTMNLLEPDVRAITAGAGPADNEVVHIETKDE